MCFAGPTWRQRDGFELETSRHFDWSRSRKTKGSLADMLQCNIWRRAHSPHRMTHSLHGGDNHAPRCPGVGRRDQFCDRLFGGSHETCSSANSGARFCGELVGARVDARRSDFGFHLFRARSRGLPSLDVFKRMRRMVLARPAPKRVKQGFCCTKSAKSAPSLQRLHLAHFIHSLYPACGIKRILCADYANTWCRLGACTLCAG